MKLLPPQLQAFVLIAECGTVHETARRLGLSQVAVTERIQTLEEALGASLFLRSRQGMQLTEAGQTLRKYATSCQELEGDFWAHFGEGGREETQHLVIHGPSSILRSRVIPALQDTVKKYPKLSVEFQLADTVSGAAALKSGDAQFAILPRREVRPEFASKLLRPEKYVLVTPAAWKGRSLKDIVETERIIDFDPTDEMTWRWLEQHGLHERARTDRHFANSTDALSAMIIAGLGYSVLTQEFASPLVAQRKLLVPGSKAPLLYEIALAWYERRHPSSIFRDVIGAVR